MQRVVLKLFYRCIAVDGIREIYDEATVSYRGVQYVHWVMHKCIMVKVGGNEIHRKYVKSR